MGAGDRLLNMTVEVVPSGEHLHLLLRGLPTDADVKQLTGLLRHLLESRAVRRVLVSARALDGELSKEAWETFWSWMAERSCRKLAWVPAQGTTELTVATLNTTGSERSPAFRAFTKVEEAERWLDAEEEAARPSARAPQRLRSDSPGAPIEAVPQRASNSYARAVRESVTPASIRSSSVDLRVEPMPESRPPSSRGRTTGTGPVRESVVRPPNGQDDPRAEPSTKPGGSSEEDVRPSRRGLAR